MVTGEKLTPEFGKHDTQVARRGITFLEKLADAAPYGTKSAQCQNERNEIRSVESTVHEMSERPQLLRRSVQHEFVRRPVHQLHHAPATPHDGPTVAPRDSRRQKTGYLPVLAPRKEMGYGHGVVLYEIRRVVPVVKRIEQLLQNLFLHPSPSILPRRYSKSPTPTTVRKRPPNENTQIRQAPDFYKSGACLGTPYQNRTGICRMRICCPNR